MYSLLPQRNKNAYFLRSFPQTFLIIYVFTMFYNLRKYVRVDKTLLRRFVCILRGRNFT